jgi:hypothetical protein
MIREQAGVPGAVRDLDKVGHTGKIRDTHRSDTTKGGAVSVLVTRSVKKKKEWASSPD